MQNKNDKPFVQICGKTEFHYGASTSDLFTRWVRVRKAEGKSYSFAEFYAEIPAYEAGQIRAYYDRKQKI